MAEKKIRLMLTSAIALAGAIKIPGDILELDESLAKNLLDRGRATLDTDARVAPEKDEGDTADIKSLKKALSSAKGRVTKASKTLETVEGTDKEDAALADVGAAEEAQEAAQAALDAALDKE